MTLARVLILAVLALVAEGGDRFTARDVDTTPTLIPATPTAVWSFTVYVEELTLTNKTATAVTCTIQDRQSTPRELFRGTIAAGTLYIMAFNGRRMPGGFTWSCSDGAAVVGYIQGKR